MPTKHKDPENTPVPKPDKKKLFHEMSEYESYNADEPEERVPDHPWTVSTEGGFADSREFYNRGQMDEVLGSDPSLRKRERPESEKMRTMNYTDRQTRFAVEDILAGNEEANIETKIDKKKIFEAIDKMSDGLDRNDKVIKKLERDLEKALNEKKVSLNHLENLARDLEKIKIPEALRKYGDNELDEEIQHINDQRKKQIKLAGVLQSTFDEKLAFKHKREENERQRLEKRMAERKEMEKIASEMGGYLSERIEAGKALDKAFSEGKRNWDKIGKLDEDMYEASLGIMLLLHKLRDENPDKALRLIPALDESVRKSFYAVLRAFFRTHNTGLTEKNIKAYGERSKNLGFTKEILQLSTKSPKEDREYYFHKDVTHLNDTVLGKLFHPVTKEEVEEVRKAA